MFYEDNDTLNANEQNVAQPKEQKEEKSENRGKKGFGLKDAATVAGAAMAGAAATYAATGFAGNPAENEEVETEEVEDNSQAEAAQAAAQSAPRTQPVEEPVTPHVETEPVASQQQAEQTTTHQEETAEQPQSEFLHENEVKIESISTETTDEGEIYHAATGTLNGHAAQFIDDGHGTVLGYAVDENDNQQIDEGEIHRVEDGKLTMGDLADNLVEVQPVEAVPASDVHVIAVENDVEFGGQTVNVAMVTNGETVGMMIDANQNGEVDILAVDANNDGDFSAEETNVVTEAHIPMPTDDDVQGYVAGNDIPDYSNDNDITVYDV